MNMDIMFEEYGFEVIVNPRKFNSGPDHLSHILSGEDANNLDESLPGAHLFAVNTFGEYFIDIFKLLSTRVSPVDFTFA